jgi:dynein heavy chain
VKVEATAIEKESVLCNAIAADCQQDLDKAMPALNAAEAALNVLTKKDMSEVKAYAKPPALVEMTLSAVMTVLKKGTDWADSKAELGNQQFLANLMNYDKDLLVKLDCSETISIIHTASQNLFLSYCIGLVARRYPS